jgi:hypothetical protein
MSVVISPVTPLTDCKLKSILARRAKARGKFKTKKSGQTATFFIVVLLYPLVRAEGIASG